jgi:hypothetical protein
MAGLNLKMGVSNGTSAMSGVQPAKAPTYNNAGTGSVMAAAFGPGSTVPVEKQKAALSPSTPTGLTLWVGIFAVVALVAIRQSLPN